MSAPVDATSLLKRTCAGDVNAPDQLFPMVYDALRHLAAGLMAHERPDHTLQATALVHEAFLRLVDQKETNWNGRVHFLAIAARAMRQILVNHAKSRRRLKRSGGRKRIPLDAAEPRADGSHPDVVALDEALDDLGSFDPRKARLVELRYFSGLTVDETAVVLRISPATVKRDWVLAKTWLRRELTKEPGE